MNIQITPNYHFNSVQNRNCTNTKPNFAPKYLNTLPNDTVSFSGGIAKTASKSVTNMREVIESTYDSHIPFYTIAANKLEDTMLAIAETLKDKGLKYDKAYNDGHGVKGKDSFMDKFVRSGDVPLDRMRRTMYMENPYDLGFFSQVIIPEFEKRGYHIYMEPVMSGKKVVARKPDCAFRLDGLSDKDLKGVRPELKAAASHGQKSGYEDIQVRFIDTTLPKSKQKPMEVLFLFGENYANAKHDESKYVYNIIREFEQRMHIYKIKGADPKSDEGKIIRNIKIICDTLRDNISKPLFRNAKNLDFYHEPLNLHVGLSENDCRLLSGLMNGILEKTKRFYSHKYRLVKSEDYNPEIIKYIKSTTAYKNRLNKTITQDDIDLARSSILDSVKLERKEDLSFVKKAKEIFAQTVQKFCPELSESKAAK